eukprot:scaffold114125_cov29-Tisochrysis_lutea.AAC.1
MERCARGAVTRALRDNTRGPRWACVRLPFLRRTTFKYLFTLPPLEAIRMAFAHGTPTPFSCGCDDRGTCGSAARPAPGTALISRTTNAAYRAATPLTKGTHS